MQSTGRGKGKARAQKDGKCVYKLNFYENWDRRKFFLSTTFIVCSRLMVSDGKVSLGWKEQLIDRNFTYRKELFNKYINCNSTLRRKDGNCIRFAITFLVLTANQGESENLFRWKERKTFMELKITMRGRGRNNNPGIIVVWCLEYFSVHAHASCRHEPRGKSFKALYCFAQRQPN